MHIAQINKFLFHRGGAETVMFRTATLLRQEGHEVSFFGMADPANIVAHGEPLAPSRHYTTPGPAVRRVRDALQSVYSLPAAAALADWLQQKQPDLAHLHNVYHQLTLSTLVKLHNYRIPTVMTIHDYKPVCPSYVLHTHDGVCHRCVGGSKFNVVRHRCIKGSLSGSMLGLVEAELVRRRRLYDLVDAFIAPSSHLAGLMVAGGVPAARIHVLPNFVEQHQIRDVPPTDSRLPHVVYVGRLEAIKGIRVLLRTAESLPKGVRVVIIGDGALADEVQAAHDRGVVSYLGRQSWEVVRETLDSAAALVLPALWEENCPMVVLEAGARGCPVIVSSLGGLPELVDAGADGIVVDSSSPSALAEAILSLAHDLQRAGTMGATRLRRTETRYASAPHYAALEQVYAAADESASARWN